MKLTAGVLFLLGILVAALLARLPPSPLAHLFRREKKAFEAARRAAGWEKLVGPTRASEEILADNQAKLDRLEEKERKDAIALLGEPQRLARYLVRVGERTRNP